jgi:RNA recognition motif-containing protein
MSQSRVIHVRDIALQATAADLLGWFSQYGEVARAQVITDGRTGLSRGFGFVEMGGGAEAALAAMDSLQHGGGDLTVNERRPREQQRPAGVDRHGARGGP